MKNEGNAVGTIIIGCNAPLEELLGGEHKEISKTFGNNDAERKVAMKTVTENALIRKIRKTLTNPRKLVRNA